MATKLVSGLSKGQDSFEAGKEAALLARKKLGNDKIDFSIVFASSKYDYKSVLKGVREVTVAIPLIGCSSAGEFTEEKIEKESVACALISSGTHKFAAGLGDNAKADELGALRKASANFPKNIAGYPYSSGIMLIDGLLGKGEEIVLAAHQVLGPNVKFSGGAAADDLKFKETNVFCGEEVANNAVSLAFVASRTPVAIGVRHGYLPLSPPLTITKAKDNVLYSIDNQPAFDIWKKYLRDHAKQDGIDVDALNIGEINSFLQYELGLFIGENYKVRVPLSVNKDNSINFTCTIVEGSVIRMMQSPREAQIASAKQAAEIALNSTRGVKLAGAIIFDCACRGIILGNEFSKSIDAIKSVIGNIPLIGFETYGEIAMELGQSSGFHNTSTVILLIPD